MERFVIGAALAVAGLFALGAVVGDTPMNLSLNFGDTSGLVGNSKSGGKDATPAEQTYASAKLRFEDGFALVRIVPEDRADIAVSLTAPGVLPAPVLRLEGDTLVIDGELGSSLRRCTQEGAEVAKHGEVTLAEAPVLTVKTPRALDVGIFGAGRAEVGAAETVDLGLRGCARGALGNVTGALKADLAGSGVLSAGAAGALDLRLAGAGRADVARVLNGTRVSVAGSGVVSITQAEGAFTADIAGSGDVGLKSGALTQARSSIAGSGSMDFGAAAIQSLTVDTMGSGDVEAAGIVGEADVSIAGSGDVAIASVTGKVTQSVMGSGEVRVGR